MSAPAQTVNFLPPAYIANFSTGFQNQLNSLSGTVSNQTVQITSMSGSIAVQTAQISSMSGSIDIFNTRTTVLVSTGSFTAVVNCSYQYNLPFIFAGSTQVVCTLPVSPVDGQFVELIDGSSTQGWGNTFYSCRVVGNGKLITGDCAAPTTSFGDLFPFRGMTVRFVYSASQNAWIGSSKGNTIPKTDDLWTGWWERINTNASQTSAYSYIDATRFPILEQQIDGVDLQTFSKRSVFSTTYYEMTTSDPSRTGPYARQLNTIAGSFEMSGPTTSQTVAGNNNLISFVGESYDYIGKAVYNPILVTRFPDAPVYVLRRMSPLADTTRDLMSYLHSIDNEGGAFYNQSLLDPVFLFNKLMKQGTSNVVNNNANLLTYQIDYYAQKQYLADIVSPAGVTFNTSISMVCKSHVFTGANKFPSIQASYTGGSTKLTDICCSYFHACMPGSNITLSGFTGSWADLNGYYPNGVSVFQNETDKDNRGRYDALFTGTVSSDWRSIIGTATGTSVTWLNRFMLLKDTSDPSYLTETTGPYKNYAGSSLIGSPIASVTHRVYSGMPLNEFFAALVFSDRFLLYGRHNNYTLYYNNAQGKLVSNWRDLSAATLPSSIAAFAYTMWHNSPQTVLNSTLTSSTTVGSSQLTSLRSLQPNINDPYQSTDFLSQQVGAIANTTAGGNALNVLPMLNYMVTGSVKNLYYGFTGGAPTTFKQITICNTVGLFNTVNPSLTGGQYITSRLGDWVNPLSTGPLAYNYAGNQYYFSTGVVGSNSYLLDTVAPGGSYTGGFVISNTGTTTLRFITTSSILPNIVPAPWNLRLRAISDNRPISYTFTTSLSGPNTFGKLLGTSSAGTVTTSFSNLNLSVPCLATETRNTDQLVVNMTMSLPASSTGTTNLILDFGPSNNLLNTTINSSLVSPTGICDSRQYILGSSNSSVNYNNFVIGQIRPDLVNNKNVGYIRISTTQNWCFPAFMSAKDFVYPSFTGPSDFTSNQWYPAFMGRFQCWSLLGKYLNSFISSSGATGCEGLVIDLRSNGGGIWPKEFHWLFGADRYGLMPANVFIDDGYSNPVTNQPFVTGANAFWTVATTGPTSAFNRTYRTFRDSYYDCYKYGFEKYRPSVVEMNYPGSTLKNCNIVVLVDPGNASNGENFFNQFLGDAGDGNLGNGCRAHVIGERTSGFSSIQGSNAPVTLPTNSRRVGLTTFINNRIDLGYAFMYTVPTGPLRGRMGFEETSVNINAIATGPNRIIGSATDRALFDNTSVLNYGFGLTQPDSGASFFLDNILPNSADAKTYKDIWLEQGLRQSIYM